MLHLAANSAGRSWCTCRNGIVIDDSAVDLSSFCVRLCRRLYDCATSRLFAN